MCTQQDFDLAIGLTDHVLGIDLVFDDQGVAGIKKAQGQFRALGGDGLGKGETCVDRVRHSRSYFTRVRSVGCISMVTAAPATMGSSQIGRETSISLLPVSTTYSVRLPR